MILDSGNRKKFDTGAVRDHKDGIGRCDLLPLKIISERLGRDTLKYINDYIYHGHIYDLWNAIDSFLIETDTSLITVFLEVSKHYEEGAKKYEERNWQKGIPCHRYVDSAVRHLLKYYRGDKDEPHDRAFVWNVLGLIWTHENHPELIDLPFIET